MGDPPEGEKREEPDGEDPVIETSGLHDSLYHQRHMTGGSAARDVQAPSYRHRNSSGAIGSDAPLLDRRPSSLANRRSGSFASIEEITGIQFNPPPNDADDSYWFSCKWLPSRHACKSIAPAELKEVSLMRCARTVTTAAAAAVRF
jgi:hypothetical protein